MIWIWRTVTGRQGCPPLRSCAPRRSPLLRPQPPRGSAGWTRRDWPSSWRRSGAGYDPSAGVASHVRIVRAAAAFGRDPDDVLRRILDVAGFAVDAVLGVDDEARIGLGDLVRIDDLIDARRAVQPGRFAVFGQVDLDRLGRVPQLP